MADQTIPKDANSPRGFKGLERARRDFEQGFHWKARDRLNGLLSNPGLAKLPIEREVEILDLLGNVHSAMGDLPEAGRYWFLSERHGPEVDAAFSAMFARHGRGITLIQQLPLRRHISEYALEVQHRINALSITDDERKRTWTVNPSGPPNSPKDWWGLLFTAIALTVLAFTLIGLVVVITFLIGG